MKIKPTNDLLFQKKNDDNKKGKGIFWKISSRAVTGMKLRNVRPTNPYQIESYQKKLKFESCYV